MRLLSFLVIVPLMLSVSATVDAQVLCATKAGVVNLRAACKKRETAVNLASLGPTGASGSQGATGSSGQQGPRGEKGDTGAAGPKGDTGPQGPKGDVGASGMGGTADVSCPQQLHTYVYQKTPALIGSEVTIGGTVYRIARIPFLEYGSGDHYAITLPISESLCDNTHVCNSGSTYISNSFTTSHEKIQVSACNSVSIGGVGGYYYLKDNREYRVNPYNKFGFIDVVETASISVNLGINETTFSISDLVYKNTYNPSSVLTDNYDLSSAIRWDRLTHPEQELEYVQQYLNYINIEKLNCSGSQEYSNGSCSQYQAPTPGVYSVGDKGPAGGYVFYVTNGGINGFEVSPVVLSGPTTWGCNGISNVGTGTALGSGSANTSQINSICSEVNIAAKIARTYVLNGYADWYLPSKDELYLIAQNFVLSRVPEGSYWTSSSDVRIGNAFYQSLSGAGNVPSPASFLPRNFTLPRVIAIRSF